jgi:hypothetical protein
MVVGLKRAALSAACACLLIREDNVACWGGSCRRCAALQHALFALSTTSLTGEGLTWACAGLSVGLVASCALATVVAHQTLVALLVHGCAVSTHVAWGALAEELICQALNLCVHKADDMPEGVMVNKYLV